MLYGNQTKMAIENFGEGKIDHKVISAYAEVKKACIMAIQAVEKRYEDKKYEAIIDAIDEIISGKLDNEFVLSLSQGGAGTSLNMNVNEVIAARAQEIYFEKNKAKINISPFDDINRYQSTNDTFPTAATIVFFKDLLQIEKLTIEVQEALVEKEKKYSNILIMGRTELQDALPMTLQQVFGSWAGMFERDRWRLHKLKERIRNIPLGGTAIGTGFPAPAEYIYKAEYFLREITKLPLSRSQNLPDSIANHDDYSELASGYSLLANNIQRLTEDFLLYTSSICQEMSHPQLQYGSTIMPNKVNPVLLEWVKGITLRVKHLSHLVSDYNVEGNFQLNAFLPFIVETMIEITDLLSKALKGIKRFIEIVIINEDIIKRNLDHSKAILNLLLPILGYEDSKELVNKMPKFSDFAEIKKWLSENNVNSKTLEKLENENIVNFIRKNRLQ